VVLRLGIGHGGFGLVFVFSPFFLWGGWVIFIFILCGVLGFCGWGGGGFLVLVVFFFFGGGVFVGFFVCVGGVVWGVCGWVVFGVGFCYRLWSLIGAPSHLFLCSHPTPLLYVCSL